MPYPPSTLYSICCGLQRYIRDVKPDLNLLKDPQFSRFQRTLDAEMKRLRSTGLGVKKRKAEPISISDENLLWEKKLLGDHSARVLLDTMVFYYGMYFALRSGLEHRNLLQSQIVLVEPPGATPYLVYTENFSKNNSGGLAQRKVEAKSVAHHANEQNPERCFVRLFKEYKKRLPQTITDSSPFYLSPLKNPKGITWYSSVAVGHNTLSKTVKRLCETADITGFKTNHSLRVTNATRLFQSGAEEQLIMERTGHRSIDGVRAYKRSSEEQHRSISYVLNAATNGSTPVETPKKLKLDSNAPIEQSSSVQTPSQKPLQQQVLPNISFTGCSNVVINLGSGTSVADSQ